MLTLREEKKRRTRDELHAAALELFFERGFEAVTADEVAERVGVSTRTFFRYFPVKAAVVFPRHRERLTAFDVALSEFDEPTPFEQVRAALLHVAQDYERHADVEWRTWDLVQSSDALMAYELRQDHEWIAAIQRALMTATRQSPGYPEFDAAVLAGAFMGAVRATLGTWYASHGKTDLQALGRRGMDLLERGALHANAARAAVRSVRGRRRKANCDE